MNGASGPQQRPAPRGVHSSAVADSGAERTATPPLPALVVVIAATCALCLPKMVPNLRLDRGIFVSVAERLLAGDRLYSQVWDNKDPLFYYALALSRAVSPYADVALEAAWIVITGFAVRRCVLATGAAPRWAVVAGFVLTPLIMTGGLVEAGYSHVPGVTLTTTAVASALAGHLRRAGAAVAVLLLLKLVMVPVAVLPILAILVMRHELHRWPRWATGFVLAVVPLLLLLQLRGELIPYLEALRSNLSYSQSGLLDPHLLSPIAHLARVATPQACISLAATVLVLIVQLPQALRRSAAAGVAFQIWVCTAASLLAAVAVLAVTGLWPQHAQILVAPALLAAVSLTARVSAGASSGRRLTAAVAGLLVAAVLLGAPAPSGTVQAVTALPQRLAALDTVPPEARALLESGRSGTYARVGQNDDDGHAFGLGAWDLVCPRFHQYPFDPPSVLRANAECLSRATWVIVSPSARPVPEATAWNAYIEEVRSRLRTEFHCGLVDGVEVCRRISA